MTLFRGCEKAVALGLDPRALGGDLTEALRVGAEDILLDQLLELIAAHPEDRDALHQAAVFALPVEIAGLAAALTGTAPATPEQVAAAAATCQPLIGTSLFQETRDIFERLARAEPDRADFQRDLSGDDAAVVLFLPLLQDLDGALAVFDWLPQSPGRPGAHLQRARIDGTSPFLPVFAFLGRTCRVLCTVLYCEKHIATREVLDA